MRIEPSFGDITYPVFSRTGHLIEVDQSQRVASRIGCEYHWKNLGLFSIIDPAVGYEATQRADLLSDDRVYQWPDKEGVVALLSDVTGTPTLGLDELTDVEITGTPFDQEVLSYDAGSGLWTNQSKISAGIQPNSFLLTQLSVPQADGVFIVGNGSDWSFESGATARTSLGLGTVAVEDAADFAVDITPDADETRSLGSQTNKFSDIHGTSIYGTSIEAHDSFVLRSTYGGLRKVLIDETNASIALASGFSLNFGGGTDANTGPYVQVTRQDASTVGLTLSAGGDAGLNVGDFTATGDASIGGAGGTVGFFGDLGNAQSTGWSVTGTLSKTLNTGTATLSDVAQVLGAVVDLLLNNHNLIGA